MSNKSKIQSSKIGSITQRADKNSVAPLSELTYSSGVVYNTNPAPPITKVNRTFQSDSDTVVVETDKDVYVNTVENIFEQKFINNVTAGALDVGTVVGTDYTSVASGVFKLGFDTDSGFDVTDLGAGVAKIAMNSTFKYWNVDGSPGLIACGLDTVNFVAGSGITITSCNTAVPKTLTINSTAGASPATPTNLGTVFGCTNSTNYNTAVGYCSGNLFNSSDVCNSVALGQCALASSSYGCNNIAIGDFSLSKQTEGSCNIAIGYGSLCCLTTGYGNISVGQLAMRNATNADTNIMIGRAAGAYMPASAAPYGNIGLGVRAFSCSGASYSIGLGSETMYYANGYGHVALGNYALFNASGDENVAIGVSSMSCVTNASSNTAIGTNSMIGRGNSDACLNTAMGYEAMSSYCTAIHNVAIGSFAMGDARGSLTQNVAVGDYSLLRMRDGGANNSALGYCSLYCVSTGNTNIGIGYCAGACITTGSNNTIIGTLSGSAGLVCTVLIGAGSCERIKVDDNGLCINGTSFNTSPGGCNTQFQYNNSGSFAGASGLTYDSATCSVGMTKITVPEGQALAVTISNQDASWYSLYGDFALDIQEDYASQVQYDSQGNIYIIGADGNDGIPYLTKYDSLGTILWQFNFTEANNYYKTGDALAIDSSDNVYCAVGTDDSITDTTIFKITSSGSIVWQTTLNGSGVRTASDLVVDGSGNVYACVYVGYPEPNNATIVKLNSSGVIQWQKTFVAESMYPQGITTDTSGNVIVASNYASLPTYNYVLSLIKLDSSGSLVWQKEYSYQSVSPGQITTDSSNNIYVVGKTSITPLGQYGLIMKLNSAGTIQWEVNIPPYPGVYPQPYFTGVALDSSNNLYVSGYANSGAGLGGSDLLIFKLDNLGNIIWQRAFSGIDSEYQYWYWAIKTIDVFNNKYVVTGYTNSPVSNNSEAITIQFPTDGSLIGTYSNFSYISTSFVPDTTLLTEATGATTESTGALTSASGVYSLSTATNVNTLVKTSGGINIFNITSEGSFATPNYTLPFSDGTDGQFLTTNGSGTLSWAVPIPGLDYSCNIAIRSCGNSTISGFNNVAIGRDTLYCNTIGGNNVAIGFQALYCNTVNGNNLGIGAYTLQNNTTGYSNVAIGYGAQRNNNGGSMNIGIGYDTLQNLCNSSDNIALGGCSQFGLITGNHNISLGWKSLQNHVCGSDNIAIGGDSQNSNICGFENISLGSRSLYCTTTGARNIAIGTYPLYRNTIGSDNIAMGLGALEYNSTGNWNIAIGPFAAQNNLVGQNIAIGDSSLSQNTIGVNHVAIGSNALRYNTTGFNNTAVGNSALLCNTIGSCNFALGQSALRCNTTGCANVAIGVSVMEKNCIGSFNVAIGNTALFCNTTGECNIAIGTQALLLNTTGYRNVAIGKGSLVSNSIGYENHGIGFLALYSNTTGCRNFAIGGFSLYGMNGGNDNVGIGVGALRNFSSGCFNVAIGIHAGCCTTGSCNTHLGNIAGASNLSGCNNVFLGNDAQGPTASSCNTITLGNNAITCIRAQVTTISALSDQRDKTNIQDLPLGLQFILDLRPVKFTWNMRDGAKVGVADSGFIAQEVLSVEDKYNVAEYLDMVGRENPDKLEVKPAKLIPILVKAIQELNEIVATQGEELSKLKSRFG